METGIIFSEDGVRTEFKVCPDASSNLLPSLAITRKNQSTLASTDDATDSAPERHWMKIACKSLELKKSIDCVLVFDIFRITKRQMFDILCRGGLTVEERHE